MYNVVVVDQNVEVRRFGKSKRKHNGTYDRMLDLAAQALLEVTFSPKSNP